MTSAAVTTVRPTIAVASKKQSDSPKATKKSAKKRTAKKAAKGKSLKERLQERGRKQDAMLIHPLVKENPCGEGTFCWAQVQAALTSKTVKEAKAKLATMKENPTKDRAMEVGWMMKKGYIELREA